MHAQVSQAHVTIVLCKLTFSQESRCYITSNLLRVCMRNKILRSANAKYYSYLFFYEINKEDFPLMHCCEFIDLVGFFGCYCLPPVPLFIIL